MAAMNLLRILCISCAALALAGLAWFDGIAARQVAGLGDARITGGAALGWLDIAAGKGISNFLLGFLLLLGAGGLLLLGRRRGGRTMLYIGAVQFSATVVADLAKPQLGRLRPYEALQDGIWNDAWWVGANSFPSGHTAFYAGLFFPLVLIAPRWSALWIALPLLVALSRVLALDHYPADVAASLALAALMAILFARIAPPTLRSAGQAEPLAAQPPADHQDGDHG